MIFRLALLLSLLLAGAAPADEDIAVQAQLAQDRLAEARVALEEAERARDRVAALTQTIAAYEEGLAALRAEMRNAALRESEIRARFDAEAEELSRLLGVLSAVGSESGPVVLLHPAGPLGTARAGMLVSSLTPALQEEVDALRADLEELSVLTALQDDAFNTLQSGLQDAQAARIELSKAVSERTDLPRRFIEDPVRLQALVAASDTLATFAAGLSETPFAPTDTPIRDFASARGSLPLPVQGTILRRPGEADAAGIRRPGVILAAAPRALVRTPWAATIRYRGPLLDYGNVMILEPAADMLLVLAGLGEVYGEVGEVLPAGAPVALMPGEIPDADRFFTNPAEGGGGSNSETLYIELRQDGAPVDPLAWFAVGKE